MDDPDWESDVSDDGGSVSESAPDEASAGRAPLGRAFNPSWTPTTCITPFELHDFMRVVEQGSGIYGWI